jgi:hypothetical protein
VLTHNSRCDLDASRVAVWFSLDLVSAFIYESGVDIHSHLTVPQTQCICRSDTSKRKITRLGEA